ncbi:MAG TPA: isoprenylcysteine carboxylmethyltransferase family protein [Candidatus Binatia bacterium]|jgi:protein-S-isoprenylcysteine O-methyltransferase Ste14|nr:isoprenylcysteine carboxylmethyltransferase family protein [Candidatus Binatia bacterium]
MLIGKLIVGIILNVAVFAALLFLPAGTWAWWRAWVFLGVIFVAMVASTVSIFRVNKDVLTERLKPPIQQGQPPADKLIVSLFLVMFVGSIVFIPLDVFRFHLLGKPGTLVSSVGLIFVVAGWWIITLALQENAFAAPVVKHQAERQQRVIDTGVYGLVRHPMYAGGILLLIGMPLWLESTAAALLASVPSGTLAVRILVEEEFLRRELKGYETYTERTRYRLIPFLW